MRMHDGLPETYDQWRTMTPEEAFEEDYLKGEDDESD